uniref:Uncharacterized protein n=1 Tax=Chlamydomonas euryale TaxID=1486919 RepID=A0A7R9UZ71_9CHLO
MAALVRSAAPTATAKRNPRGMLAPAPRPARVVLRRFRPDNAPQKMEKDRSGAQHTGYKHGHDDLSDQKLSSTVAGTYEWQMIYLAIAGTFIFLPFFPGATSLAKALYEVFGGHLL